MRTRAPLGFLLLLSLTSAAYAQTVVTVELDDVSDNRISAGELTGSLDVHVKLTGTGLDRASGARVLVKEAKDDRGTSLVGSGDKPDFTPRDYNSGMLQLSLKQPTRSATSVKVKGTVELFVPARDPGSVATIDKALAKLDTPLTAKALKAAKLTITPLSKAGYAAALKSRKLDDKAIEAIRAEGRARGVAEKEIELMIGLAKALEASDAEVPEGAVLLSGTKADFDRIFRIEVLGADGKPLNIPSRSTSSRGDDSLMMLQPSEPLPANASLQFFLLTDKSRLSFPFELNVRLP
jgi:hypothetical protein